MGQAVGTYEGVRIYGPRPDQESVEKKLPRIVKKMSPGSVDPDAPLAPAIHRRTSGKGKPYYVEGYAMPLLTGTGFVFFSDYKGKVFHDVASVSDVITDLTPVKAMNPEDDVRMSWDDAKLAWRACRLFAEADLCGKPERASKLRVEAHGIVQQIKSRIKQQIKSRINPAQEAA